MVDKLGQEIKEGSIIVYPISVASHSTLLRIGKVVRLEDDQIVFVRGVYDRGRITPVLCDRNGRLEDPKKIIVLPHVPEPYKTLLDKLAGML